MGARHLPPPQKTLKINMFCEVLGIGQGAPTTSQLPKSFRNHKRKEGGGGTYSGLFCLIRSLDLCGYDSVAGLEFSRNLELNLTINRDRMRRSQRSPEIQCEASTADSPDTPPQKKNDSGGPFHPAKQL